MSGSIAGTISIDHALYRFWLFSEQFPIAAMRSTCGVQRLHTMESSFDYGQDSETVTKVDTGKNFSWP